MTNDNNEEEWIPENIRVRVSVKDPNAADGETLHQQYVLTEEELEHIKIDQQGYMEAIIRHMATGMATKWSEERHDSK